jgi:hypothetical protein
MKSAIQQVVTTVMVVALCLSAQVGILALGNSFRVAARMAAPTAGTIATVPEMAAGPVQVAARRVPGGQW